MKQQFVGSVRYASKNCLQGLTVSRRDDCESFFYMIVEFAAGNLPWSYTMHGPDVRAQIKSLKETTSTESLCHGFPSEFDAIWTYIRSLGFEDRPDYCSIKDMIEMA